MLQCNHCQRSLGSLSKSGEHRIRGLSIILVDPATGRIHGPCARCDGDFTLHDGTELIKALTKDSPVEIWPGIRLSG